MQKVHLRYPRLSFCLQVGNDDSMTVNNDVLRSNLLAKYEWLVEKTMHDSEFKSIRVLLNYTHIYGEISAAFNHWFSPISYWFI